MGVRERIKKVVLVLLATLACVVLIAAVITPTPTQACGITDPMNCVGDFFKTLVQAFINILKLSGFILQAAIKYFVIEMHTYVDPDNTERYIPAIHQIWAMFRDMANIVFIFALLYAAIAMILNLHSIDTKRTVFRVVVIALLINFSFFLTGFVIDTSNILALQFYNNIDVTVEGIPPEQQGIGTAYFHILRAQTGLNFAKLEFMPLLTSTLLTLVIVGVAFFIMIAAAILLAIRFVVLLLLLMLSPLAFAAKVLPNTERYWTQWLNSLVHNSFFAPAYLAMTYISLSVIHAYNETLGEIGSYGELGTTGVPSTGTINVIVMYLVAIILMVASIILAKMFGAVGAQTINGWGKGMVHGSRRWAQGKAGRGLVGAPSNALARQANRLKESLEERGFAGRQLGRMVGGLNTITFEKGATAKFGSSKSRRDIVESKNKNVEAGLRTRRGNPARTASYMQGLSGAQQEHAYEKMSANDRARVERELHNLGAGGLATHLRSTISIEEQEKVDTENRNIQNSERNRNVRDAIREFATTGTTTRTNHRTGTTFTNLTEAVRLLPDNEARKLSPELRRNPMVIRELSTRHLRDLQMNAGLDQEDIDTILAEIRGATAYPNQAEQLRYVNERANRSFWR